MVTRFYGCMHGYRLLIVSILFTILLCFHVEYTGDNLLGSDSEDSEDDALFPRSCQHFRDLQKRASECMQADREVQLDEQGVTSSGHVRYIIDFYLSNPNQLSA